MLMSVGCTKEGLGENTNTESEKIEVNTEVSTEIESETTENTETETQAEGIVYSELSRDTIVSDEEMVSKVLQLLLDEKELIYTLDCECEMDFEDFYEVNGILYYRVVEADNWDYYEDIARNYYTEDYLERKFNQRYMVDTKLFVESNGKLYRSQADGVIESFYEDAIEVWQAEAGMYYVTILANTVGGGDFYRGYIIQMSENNSYGFEIVDKVIVY